MYNRVAKAIADGKLKNTLEILRELRSIYLSDGQFRNAFEERQLRTTQNRNKRLVRYILFQLERQLTNRDYDFDSERYTIEHVLPENPKDGWPQFSDDQIERFVYRLGNMTLLQAAPNRDQGNKPYAEKQVAYQASEFEITQKVAEENSEWTVERIAARQRWMAKQATAIWRIAQLAST